MKIEKKTFKQKKSSYFTTKAFGPLYIFNFTIGDQVKLSEEMEKTIDEYKPEDFIRIFIKYVCYPEQSLKEELYKPDQKILTEEDTNSLEYDELNQFSGLYIKDNEYLYREETERKKKEADGKTVIKFEYGDVKHPQNENENNIDYLHRLLTLEEKKLLDTFKNIANSISSVTNFSKNLQSQIKKTFSLGDSLRNTFGSIKSWQSTFPEKNAQISFPSIDYSDLAKTAVESRNKPFRELAERLDSIIDTSTKMADFMIEMNTTQVGIAKELKRSGDKASNFSKINVLLSIIIIILTIVSLSLGFYIFYSDKRIKERQAKFESRYITKITEHLTSLNTGTFKFAEKIEASLKELSNKYSETSETNQKNILTILEEQKLLLEELKKSREHNIKRIEKLNTEIELIYKELNKKKNS